MKKLYFLALLLWPMLANAQMKTWENFSDSEVDHPFKYNYVTQPENNIDSKGNKWVLNSNSIWKINGTDTTKFTNFPITNTTNRGNSMLSILDDKVAFWHYRYDRVNNVSSYTNYLGYYNGSEMKYFSEVSMNVGTSTTNFTSIKQTEKYVWIAKGDKLIGFDKNNTFTSYNSTNSVFEEPISQPQLERYVNNEIILVNYSSRIYKFNDQNGQWEKVIPSTDLIRRHSISDSTKIIYIVGRDNIYSYSNSILQTFLVPNIGNLGNVITIQEIKKNLFIATYDKGFVFIDNGQVHIKFFADYTDDATQFVSLYESPIYLDNGILVFKYDIASGPASSGVMYFSYYNNEVKFECEKPYIGNNSSFFYKEMNGETYYCYFVKWDPIKIFIEKNYTDTTIVQLPYRGYANVKQIAVDKSHIWFQQEQDPQNPFFVLRMKRDQYFLKGNLFYDLNQNGLKETTEVGVSKYPIKINPSGLLVFPDRDGNFAFAGEPGEKYTMELPDATLFNYTSKPLPYTFSESDNNLIGITLANPQPEVRTNFITPWPRCGTTGKTTLQIENTGFEPIEKVQLVLVGDPNAEINSTQAQDKKVDTLVFELTNLLPLNTQSLSYDVTFPGGEMTGQKLNFQLQSSIFSNGSIVKSTIDSINTIVRCSYDPNDKSVTPTGTGSENYTLKNSTLNYLIRFENTGNDTAYTVTVYDTLDTNLDHFTFEVIGSSHKLITELSAEGVLIFHFEDIMLPDNKTNSEKAHGFVRYSIQPKPNLPENTVVRNNAGIVFDSNEPIITNETYNTLVTSMPLLTSVENAEKSGNLVYPNPARTIVHIAGDKSANVKVYDFTGRHIETFQSREVNASNWAEGVYLFRMFDANGNSLGSEKVQLVK